MARVSEVGPTVTHEQLVQAICKIEDALPGAFSGLIRGFDPSRPERHDAAIDGLALLCALTNGTVIADQPASPEN
jgi:predicted benzoate:H+ symporter BenE